MAQIRIDDEVYDKLKEAAEFNKRTVGQHILFLLDNELTFNEIRGMLVKQNFAAPASLAAPTTPTPSHAKTVTLDDVKKAMREMEADRKRKNKPTVDNLTEKDLAKAKVEFKDRPDFKEPEKWDGNAWPTV